MLGSLPADAAAGADVGNAFRRSHLRCLADLGAEGVLGPSGCLAPRGCLSPVPSKLPDPEKVQYLGASGVAPEANERREGCYSAPRSGAGVGGGGGGRKRHDWSSLWAFFCTLTLKPLSMNYSDKNKMVLTSKIYVISPLFKPVGHTDTKREPNCRLRTSGDNVVSTLFRRS